MRVVCYGDSNTYGYDSRSFFGSRFSANERWVDIFADKTGWTVINEGMNGREVRDCNIIPDNNADFMIIMLGTNDILQGKTAVETASRIQKVLENCQSDRVLLIAPPSLRLGEWVRDSALIDESIQLSKEYERVAIDTGTLFANAGEWDIELLYDGVHFSEKGHLSFAEGLYNYFEKLLDGQ